MITDLRSKYPISRKTDTIYRENYNSKHNILIKNSDEIRLSYPEKTIWLYSGYTWEQIMHPIITDDFNIKRDQLLKMRQDIVKQCDVLVDGRYEEDKRDVTYHWAGSTNQRVIDVQETLKLLKMRQDIVKQCDVLVDGRYEEDKRDVTYHWAGSTNQRVIDVQETLKQGKVILWENQ